jgi:long-chain acyl-CoA synthetase
LRAFARETLTAYKVPKHLYAVEDLPRSIVGKVIRRQVREQLLGGQA